MRARLEPRFSKGSTMQRKLQPHGTKALILLASVDTHIPHVGTRSPSSPSRCPQPASQGLLQRAVCSQARPSCLTSPPGARVVEAASSARGGLGDTTPAILAGTKRTENSFGIIWPSPRQLRVNNTLRVGHRGSVGRKTTQKPPQNTKKWKKIVKKRLFDGFGHVGQNSVFSRKNQKNGYFLTSQNLLWHKYTPKVACESIPTCFGHI